LGPYVPRTMPMMAKDVLKNKQDNVSK